MGVFSELNAEIADMKEDSQAEFEVQPFTLDNSNGADSESIESGLSASDDDVQQAEAAPAAAALLMKAAENADDDAAEDLKKKEHEEKEAQRKAEWEARQKSKKEAEEAAMQALLNMSDDELTNASVKRIGIDAERLTRRNMKMCVAEYIQTKCLDDLDFARKAMNPKKNMIRCYKFINRHAYEFIKQEMADNDEKPIGNGIGSDVPDDLCYQWAEEYFLATDAEEDKEQEDKFVPKPYYKSPASKSKKKEPTKKKEPASVEKPVPVEQMQLAMTEASVS